MLYIEVILAIVAILVLYDLLVCLVTRFSLLIDFYNAFIVLVVMSCLKALSVSLVIFLDLV